MRIYFERSGGFMGLRVAGTVDTDALAAEEADTLVEMVESAGFFSLPAQLLPTSEGGDRFQYRLVVEDESRRHSVETDGSAVPESLWPLLRRLTILTRAGQDRFDSN